MNPEDFPNGVEPHACDLHPPTDGALPVSPQLSGTQAPEWAYEEEPPTMPMRGVIWAVVVEGMALCAGLALILFGWGAYLVVCWLQHQIGGVPWTF